MFTFCSLCAELSTSFECKTKATTRQRVREREREAERGTGRSRTCRARRRSQIAGLEVCTRRVLGFSVFRAMFDVSCQKIHRRRPIDCRRLSMHTACCAAFLFAIFLAYAYV